MFDTYKTRMIGLLCGEKAVTINYFKPFLYENVTERQTELLSHVSVLTRGNKNGELWYLVINV